LKKIPTSNERKIIIDGYPFYINEGQRYVRWRKNILILENETLLIIGNEEIEE
jgi:hypothetical protein